MQTDAPALIMASTATLSTTLSHTTEGIRKTANGGAPRFFIDRRTSWWNVTLFGGVFGAASIFPAVERWDGYRELLAHGAREIKVVLGRLRSSSPWFGRTSFNQRKVAGFAAHSGHLFGSTLRLSLVLDLMVRLISDYLLCSRNRRKTIRTV